MKKSIIVGLVMVSVMAFGNTLQSEVILINGFTGIHNHPIYNPSMGRTTGLSSVTGPQVSSYSVVVTNYSREPMRIGIRDNDYAACLLQYRYPYLSETDYYETEIVTKRNMLKYDIDGISGETCIKQEVLSKKRREVKQAVTTSMQTNDWVNCEGLHVTNIVLYATNCIRSIGIRSIAWTNDWRALIKE